MRNKKQVCITLSDEAHEAAKKLSSDLFEFENVSAYVEYFIKKASNGNVVYLSDAMLEQAKARCLESFKTVDVDFMIEYLLRKGLG